MGKHRQDSDDEMAMDIELPAVSKTKKNKLISKKQRNQPTQRSASSKTTKSTNIVREFSKQVNLKNKSKPLEAKQAIFNKIVQGLKDKAKATKKNKKLTRVLLKKQLRKHLEEERVHNRKKSTQGQQGTNTGKESNTQQRNPQKFRKKQINQRQISSQFHKLMGSGLANLRNIVMQNTFKPVTRS